MNQNILHEAVEVLSQQGVILYPTDTIWGLGCDATSDLAIEKIFKIKNRPVEKGIIVLLDDKEKLSHYVEWLPQKAYNLIEYYEQPLTIIYEVGQNLSNHCYAPDGSIAIRIVKDEYCKRLITTFGKPITSTSANISGQPNAASLMDIHEDIKNNVDLIVKIQNRLILENRASRIIRFDETGEIVVLR